jgi:ParB-like chromosome segregation protein Spo0J
MQQIPDTLADLAVPIDSVVPYYKNPRRGDVEMIKESLEVNGQYRPIFVNKGTLTGRPNEILGGNHTWQAAFELGWEQIAATWLDVDDATAERLVVIDNRANDKAWYDEAELLGVLESIATNDPTLGGTGFTVDDLSDLTAKLNPPSMDELADLYGEPTVKDTWPTLRLPLPKTLHDRTLALMASYEGEPHEQWEQIIDAAAP